MSINEIFKNPTVKQVIFQIRYPNLFYIENKIGDYQIKIMKEFPESSLFVRRNLVVVDAGENEKIEELSKKIGVEPSKKVWQFKSKSKTILSVSSDSLDISSEFYKTYDREGEEKFRDIIKFVVDEFKETVSLPIIERIGLRYIDECPLPTKDNTTFNSYYNSALSMNRFDIKNMEKMDFSTTVHINGSFLNYRESLMLKDGQYKLILDFDGFTTDVDCNDYLKVTDTLHNIILAEYEKTIKEPVIEYMRE